MSHSYRELRVWQKAMDMVTEVYRITGKFPKHELYGLANQLQRSAVSVPSNIAEGQGRASRREFSHFLANARGSLLEMETQLLIAVNLGYIKHEEAEHLLSESQAVNSMLNGLIASMSDTAAASAT